MSAATLAAPAAQPGRRAIARARRQRLNPLEALERGFALFRSTFAQEAWRYYVGSAPLVLCFIPMWVVDGQIQLSSGAVLVEAALLSAAYMLRAWTVASYMQRVRERAFGVPRVRLPSVFAQVAAMARLLTWKILLSLAALAALATMAGPSWFYSACQFASLEARDDGSEKHSMGGCLALAGQWFGPGLLFLFMMVPLWIAVWLNGFILAIVLPQLLHSIFGVGTLLSTEMGIFALLRSSAFWLSLFAGAWIALDPVVKCSFVVVYQDLRSRREGDDLRGLLASLPRELQRNAQVISSTAARGGAVIGAFLVLLGILAVPSQAASTALMQTPSATRSTDAVSDSAHEEQVQRLRRALSEESQRSIYQWHDAEHPSPPTWFDKLLDKTGNAIERVWKKVTDFLSKLWPHLNLPTATEGSNSWHLKDLRLWLVLIVILTAAAGAVLVWLRRRREATQLAIPLSLAPLPDLSDAAVATQRSEDEWFGLAARLEREGDLRLSLRAAYLGLLAGLAQREWFTIRRDRTNREYLDEFTRRWRRRPQAAVAARAEVPEKLRGSLRQFDRVWYGSHVPTLEGVAAYRRDQKELLSHV